MTQPSWTDSVIVVEMGFHGTKLLHVDEGRMVDQARRWVEDHSMTVHCAKVNQKRERCRYEWKYSDNDGM